ncbi:MAG: GNAT family N-acetyltransferase [Chloroflexota bacterium]|nr:GNAT family N-acetyltransferase [Chloroflexota bacterium]
MTADAVDVPGAPEIPGLRLRRYRGATDLPGMLDAFHASGEADGSEQVNSLPDMENAYAHLSNCDPDRDILVFEVDSEIIGYSRRYWAELNEGGRTYESFGFLRPEWRRRGIATAVLRWNEAGLREIAAGHGEIGPKWLASGALDTAAGNVALLKNAGYQPVRYGYDMVRPTLDAIPNAPLPDGVELRPVTPDQLRRIWEADIEAFRDHWGERDESEESYERIVNSPDTDFALWQVAWDGDDVAGLVWNSIDEAANRRFRRARGWLDSVAVRRPWRRRGLARALIASSLRVLRERGMTSAGLGVDTENPSGALRLYESMGFEPIRRFTSFRKLLEV